jgi:hypothetical protein
LRIKEEETRLILHDDDDDDDNVDENEIKDQMSVPTASVV